jgi:class 3 adenylate cyclase
MATFVSDPENPRGRFKRRLRAAFSADIANFSGNVSVSETRAFGNLADILEIGRDELARHEGVLLGVPGDGLFGLFESVVNAVHCAITIQQRLTDDPSVGTAMRLRIGVHLGDVLFDGDVPFGETLNIAARLQALADPGGTLVSSAVVDAVSARVPAHFEARGVPQLKNIPRRIATFAVYPRITSPDSEEHAKVEPLDHTMQLPSRTKVRTAASSSDGRAAQEYDTATTNPIAAPAASRANFDVPPAPQGAPAPPQLSEGHPPDTAPSPAAPPIAHVSRSPHSALDQPLTAEVLAYFGDTIAVHLGPVGRVMTARKAKSCATLGDLLAALEPEIPTAAEQHTFRSRIKRQFER